MRLKILILLVAPILTFAQLTIKDVTIGERISGELNTFTTLGGISMYRQADTISDGRVYGVIFTPEKDGSLNRVYQADVDKIKEGLSANFDVNFIKRTEDYSDDYSLFADKGLYRFVITVEYNQFFDKPCEMQLLIIDKSLYSIWEKEEQEKANSDF